MKASESKKPDLLDFYDFKINIFESCTIIKKLKKKSTNYYDGMILERKIAEINDKLVFFSLMPIYDSWPYF